MRITRLSAPLGAVVEGVDVRRIDKQDWLQINQLFCEHHVLIFPGQSVSPGEQMTFAKLWGDLVPFPYGGLPDYPNIIELRNRGKSKDVNQHWHSDMTYNPEPPKLTMLYALEAPAVGGETAFANQILAYQDLSEGMRDLLDNLQAQHSAKGLARLYGRNQEEASEAVHPVVRTHDESGAKALYVCRAFTTRFCNWSRAESKPILEYLFEHAVRPEYQARHQWRAGDLVMWDNRCLQHYAVHDHGDDARIIHRCQVVGQAPA
ncbi:MAG: TauD/TfdA family dioxygenase [Pseudomonadota bacterium]